MRFEHWFLPCSNLFQFATISKQANKTAAGGALPLVAGDAVHLNYYSEVYALNAATGAQLWHHKLQAQAREGDETVSVGGD